MRSFSFARLSNLRPRYSSLRLYSSQKSEAFEQLRFSLQNRYENRYIAADREKIIDDYYLVRNTDKHELSYLLWFEWARLLYTIPYERGTDDQLFQALDDFIMYSNVPEKRRQSTLSDMINEIVYLVYRNKVAFSYDRVWLVTAVAKKVLDAKIQFNESACQQILLMVSMMEMRGETHPLTGKDVQLLQSLHST